MSAPATASSATSATRPRSAAMCIAVVEPLPSLPSHAPALHSRGAATQPQTLACMPHVHRDVQRRVAAEIHRARGRVIHEQQLGTLRAPIQRRNVCAAPSRAHPSHSRQRRARAATRWRYRRPLAPRGQARPGARPAGRSAKEDGKEVSHLSRERSDAGGGNKGGFECGGGDDGGGSDGGNVDGKTHAAAAAC